MTSPTITLPPLDEDCPHCTGEAGDEMRAANLAAWNAWNDEESGAYSEFAATFDRTGGRGDAWTAWQQTDHYWELKAREPEQLPDSGCVECDWMGRRLTDAGRQVLEFVRRWS